MWPRRTVTPVEGTSAILMVSSCADGVSEVEADLLVSTSKAATSDVVDVVLAELKHHQTRNRGLGVGIAIVVDTLDQRKCAVTYADNGDTNRM